MNDFGSSCMFVCEWIIWVLVLVENDTARYRFLQSFSDTYVNSMVRNGILLKGSRCIPMLLSSDSEGASVGVRTISAPSAFNVSSFSNDIFSGSVIIKGYPYMMLIEVLRQACEHSTIPSGRKLTQVQYLTGRISLVNL